MGLVIQTLRFIKMCRDEEGNIHIVGPLGIWMFPIWTARLSDRITEEQLSELPLCTEIE